jgi:D-alanyl-lipoteichoic acid acyltransferase DltB (MBOAT superfamily)
MLFNSYIFIFAFLPLTFCIYFGLNGVGLSRAGKLALLGCSWIFYSYWNPVYFPLLLGSTLFNYSLSMRIISLDKNNPARKRYMLFAVCTNVGLLLYFKYMDFFIFNVDWLTGLEIPYLHLALPLAISFFTLQQIAFIVDSYRAGLRERNFIDYALFVSFFPQLIAGPIVHHREVMPQFAEPGARKPEYDNLALGFYIFAIGLFKKVVIADTFATWANNGFDSAQSLNLLEAWLVHYSYTFQLYYDFCGYSDMAIGLALMFNIALPVNFNSPYKATSIINLWQRWHMTLTRFINTYIYKPILRSFPSVTFGAGLAASFLSMVVAGMWHGAAWTFVVFGVLHGVAIVINHIWRKLEISMPDVLGWFITFHFFSLSLVIFRATSWEAVQKLYRGMMGFSGLDLSVSAHKIVGGKGPWFFDYADTVAQKNLLATVLVGGLVALFIAIVYFCPNSMELKDRFRVGWRPLLVQVVLFCCAVMMITQASEFIYFQF